MIGNTKAKMLLDFLLFPLCLWLAFTQGVLGIAILAGYAYYASLEYRKGQQEAWERKNLGVGNPAQPPTASPVFSWKMPINLARETYWYRALMAFYVGSYVAVAYRIVKYFVIERWLTAQYPQSTTYIISAFIFAVVTLTFLFVKEIFLWIFFSPPQKKENPHPNP